MPLPQDEKVVALADDILQQFDRIFGLHPGFRPAHAKGLMLSGSFRPSPAAAELSKAPHLTRESTPITVRFSNSTGLPLLPDNVADANPRGMAVRFHLAEHVHTDIVAHSTDGFPVQNGQQFLEFLRAVADSGPDVPSPKPVEQFVASHPATLAFAQTPKPFASSFARLTYFAVTAFAFTNEAGERSCGRYRLVPEEGEEFLPEAKVAGLPSDYHFQEITARIAEKPIRFKLVVQRAASEDRTDDATVRWPETRPLLELGTLEVDAVLPDNPVQQKSIIFDPIPRVEGIEPSADPLLELRAAIYLISGRRRRSASQEEPVR